MDIIFSPLTACKSLSAHSKGAYRLYVLAKAMAEGARYIVNTLDVSRVALEFISGRQIARDERAAVRLGLFRIEQGKSGEKVYILTSHHNAAICLGATKSSASRRATVSLADLFSDKWQAIAFTKWQDITTRYGLLLTSQKKQAERTGIQPQMQQRYNKVCGVVSRNNYAVSNISANHLDAVREFSTRAAPFAFKNHKTNQSYIAWRLPSTRVVCADSSAINKSIIDGSLISTNPNVCRKGSRLFLYGEMSFTKALKSCGPKQRDLYLFSYVSKSGAGMFTHFAV